MTSGYRADIGYVFIIDWSATDKPHEGLFYPRFNFLSSDLVPPPNTAERDTYLDAVAKVLIPESKSGDKYFTEKRSEERRVGKECVSTCRSRRSRFNTKNKKNTHTTATNIHQK